jgi:hypothetical protein
LAVPKPLQLLEAPGLCTLLCSDDFGAWDSLVAGSLGHHRSRLLPGSPPFRAHIRRGAVADFEVLQLHGVLWLPLQGLTQEWVNGIERLAEPGMALLFRPGDAMQGFTSDAITGLSILIPGACLPGVAPPSPLLDQGPVHRRLIATGLQLAMAAAWQPQGSEPAAADLEEALQQWGHPPDPGRRRERLTACRLRQTVAEACRWMEDHLCRRFSLEELGLAMGISVRSLQYGFREPLGRPPMAELKRRRLRRHRGDYGHGWGESPRRMRQRRTMDL